MHSFACRDAATLAQFWSQVLKRPVDQGATTEYATIGFDADGPTWMFVRSDDLAEGRNRLMLDLAGEDRWLQEAERAEGLGGRRIADHDVDGARWVELRDPENNTFRIFAPRPQ
ncbi:MAG: glyoxalase/bleomycin resistance/dioxygenase family protein [Pseudonocardiales bacterium]|nr:MAG: glyoxalase/bleomycin resistance/dioxygenase family protein [Pseudonocardiales bacterium]